MLAEGERCLCEIAPHFHQDPSVVCRHLQLLERTGVVLSRRDGQRIFYRLADHRMVKLVEAALDIAEHPGRAHPVGARVSREERKC